MRLCPAASVAVALLGSLSACSSGSPAPASEAPPNPRGAYVATNAGPIADLTFVDGAGHADSYVLHPAGCAEEACVERGTYAVDATRGTLTLTNAATGKSASLPFHVASDPASTLGPGAAAGAVTIHPKTANDLVGSDPTKITADTPSAITVGPQTLLESRSFEITNDTGSQLGFHVQLYNPDPSDPDSAVPIGARAGISLTKGTVALTPGRQDGLLTDKTIAVLDVTDPGTKTTIQCAAGQLPTTSKVAFTLLPLTCPDGWTPLPPQQ